MATFAPKNGHCSDAFKPLMEIWMKLKEDPKGLIDWYAERRTRVSEKNKIEIYEDIKAFEKRVQEWHARTKYLQFSIMDYQEAFDLAKEGDHLL